MPFLRLGLPAEIRTRFLAAAPATNQGSERDVDAPSPPSRLVVGVLAAGLEPTRGCPPHHQTRARPTADLRARNRTPSYSATFELAQVTPSRKGDHNVLRLPQVSQRNHPSASDA